MILNIDMLGSRMVFGIVCEGNGALIVAVNDILIVHIVADFLEESQDPDLLFESVYEGHIF